MVRVRAIEVPVVHQSLSEPEAYHQSVEVLQELMTKANFVFDTIIARVRAILVSFPPAPRGLSWGP